VSLLGVMDYDQIDVLDKGIVWQGGAMDDAIDSPPFAGPLLVVCMDRGEEKARIKARRPIPDPNPGFLAQLRQLWP
jgi:hypothetical protein